MVKYSNQSKRREVLKSCLRSSGLIATSGVVVANDDETSKDEYDTPGHGGSGVDLTDLWGDEDADQVGTTEFTSNEWWGDTIYNSSSIWHFGVVSTNITGRVTHRFGVASMGYALDEDQEFTEEIHQQWSEASTYDGELDMLTGQTLARFGKDGDEEEEDSNPPVNLYGNAALVLGGLLTVPANWPVAAAISSAGVVNFFFNWDDYISDLQTGGEVITADWGNFSNSHALHIMLFDWTFDQSLSNATVAIDTMTGAAGQSYEISADSDSYSANSNFNPTKNIYLESESLYRDKR